MLGDKAFDWDGQLFFDIFEFDGFMGDVVTVSLAVSPYFEVERRKYRFRLLNGSTARFYKIALANASGTAQPMIQIANDGNLLPHPVTLTQLDHLGVAERYDIVIDFSTFAIGEKLHLVNLADHFDDEDSSAELNGKKVVRVFTLAAALSGTSQDPGVGRVPRVPRRARPGAAGREPRAETLIPNPDHSDHPGGPGADVRVQPRRAADRHGPDDDGNGRVGHRHRQQHDTRGRLRSRFGGAPHGHP